MVPEPPLRVVQGGETVDALGRNVPVERRKDMKIKTSELTGIALDWAVAKCEGDSLSEEMMFLFTESDDYAYSIDWALSGSIIEREINVIECDALDQQWHAVKYDAGGSFNPFANVGWHAFGRTPLIAAMRCYVASKLGDEVDVPDELVPSEPYPYHGSVRQHEDSQDWGDT